MVIAADSTLQRSEIGKLPSDCARRFVVTFQPQIVTAKTSSVLIGSLCGIGAAFCWAAGFVAAKHGISIGFSPTDIAFHRFFWSGLLLMPLILREGIFDLGGIGWSRGLLMSVLSGPPQAVLAYTGFTLVPLGHGTTIQPACSALFGLVLATLVLREKTTIQRIGGGATIIAGLLVFGVESIVTIGSHGMGGDLLFATAGLFWAIFGTQLRAWNVSGTRAVAAVGSLSVMIFAPLYLMFIGYGGILRMSFAANILQILVQGVLAGALPIYLFSRAVSLLGAGRAATFPALVPGFGLAIGYIALGFVPSLLQLIGLAMVVLGFRLALR
jgi:drug/metabolite transporter (DMT)-like permease